MQATPRDARSTFLKLNDLFSIRARKASGSTLMPRRAQRGVVLRLGVSVKEVTEADVLLSDGSRLDTKLVVWRVDSRHRHFPVR